MNTTHNRQQQIKFLYTINQVLDEPMLDLEIRSRLQGEDLQLKRHLKSIGEQSFSKVKAYDMLYIYSYLHRMHSNAVKTIAGRADILFECYEDVLAMKEELNKFLPTIDLPVLTPPTDRLD